MFLIFIFIIIINIISPEDGVWLLHVGVIENGRTRNHLTLWTASVVVHVQVWEHILGDPQSVQLRNATKTTTTLLLVVVLVVVLAGLKAIN